MAHSNQVREFILSSDGIRLVDVYVGAGAVLTGAARLAQEAKDRQEAKEREEEIERQKAGVRSQETFCGSANRRDVVSIER